MYFTNIVGCHFVGAGFHTVGVKLLHGELDFIEVIRFEAKFRRYLFTVCVLTKSFFTISYLNKKLRKAQMFESLCQIELLHKDEALKLLKTKLCIHTKARVLKKVGGLKKKYVLNVIA